MTDKHFDLIKTRNGKIKARVYRTYTTGKAGRYNLRVGNKIPYRTVSGASLPMPTIVTANDISITGFKLVIGGGDYLYEVSESGIIVALSKSKEILITGKAPSSRTTLEVVAVRTDGTYSLAYTVSVITKPGQSVYPYNVGDLDPVRTEPASLDSPQQVTMSFVSPTIGRITWSAPFDLDGVEQYEVVIGNSIVAITAAGFHDMPGLSPKTSYTAKVRSINAKNQFSEVAQDTQTSPETVAVQLPAGSITTTEGDYD